MRTRDALNVTRVASSVLPLMHLQRRPPALSLLAHHSSRLPQSSVPIGDGQYQLRPRVGLRVRRNASAPTLSILGTSRARVHKTSSRVWDTIILAPSSGPMVGSAGGGGGGGKGPQTDSQCIWMRVGLLFSYVSHCLSE